MNNLFINNNNISLIWDILSENPHFVKLSDNKRDVVFHALNEDMIIFYEKFKAQHLGILDLNKMFLSQITHALKVKDLEQSHKVVSFEESLELKKKELQEYLKIEIPSPIDFSDKLIEEKISNIDELMQHVINERKFEIPPTSNEPLVEYKTILEHKSSQENNKNNLIALEVEVDVALDTNQQDIKSIDKRLIMLEEQMYMLVKSVKEISSLLYQERGHVIEDNNEDDNNDFIDSIPDL